MTFRRLIRLPAFLFLVLLIAGSALQNAVPLSLGMPTFRFAMMAGSFLLVAAFAIGVSGLVQLVIHRTTVDPGGRPTQLVTGGVFSFSRNPLYVALLLVHVALALMADSPWLLATAALLWLVLDRVVVRGEEQVLEEVFGDPYVAYRNEVRRWV